MLVENEETDERKNLRGHESGDSVCSSRKERSFEEDHPRGDNVVQRAEALMLELAVVDNSIRK